MKTKLNVLSFSVRKPYKVVLIGDFLKDLDDEHTLCGLAGLGKLGITELLCVVGNLAPADLRARGAKGTLKMLGMGAVPVGVGTKVYEGKTYDYESRISYLAGPNEVEADGLALLVRTLKKAPDGSVILVLQSGFTDAALLLKGYPELCINKIKHIAVMGGVVVEEGRLALDGQGRLIPNNANNNEFDRPAAEYLYQTAQDLGIKMVITTREVAYASQLPFAAYDVLESTGNPVGVCLKNRQLPAIQHLWEAACSLPGSAVRGTLPNDRNRAWFVKVFCNGVDPQIDDGGNVWPYVGKFNLYDPTCLYAAIPEISKVFLKGEIHSYLGVEHLVFGLTSQNHGVSNIDGFVQFMIEIEKLGLQ